MKVGFLRYEYFPAKIARCLAALASLYEVDFFYFNPESVDVKNKKIKGIFFKKGEYIELETSYPDVIDDPHNFSVKYKELYNHLSNYCFFTFTRIKGKSKLFDILGGNEEGKRYLIETFKYEDVLIDDVLEKYRKVIVKPIKGRQGREIYKINKEGDFYVVQLKNEIRRLSEADFSKQYSDIFPDSYIIQRYVHSQTNAGNPFDIRIYAGRSKNGEWKLVKLLPRIGNINVVTSNISQGGSICKIKDFLQYEFEDDWKRIYNNLVSIFNTVPDLVQNKYEKIIDALGIDTGIDRGNNSELKIFEVNTFPGSSTFEFEAAEAKIQYYVYLSETLPLRS